MKKLLTIASLLLTLSCGAQLTTNTFYSNWTTNVPQKGALCTSNVWYNGTVLYKQDAQLSNWYHFKSNIWTVQFTNPLVAISPRSAFGQLKCGYSSVTVTDSVYPQDTWFFDLFWPSNIAHPDTNLLIPITVIGETNHL